MDAWFCLVFVTLYNFIIIDSNCQTLLKIASKKLNVQRTEDYTFQSEINRAIDECSYMSLSNDTFNRNETIQLIKENINNRRLKEFYEQKEEEKQRAKEFYEHLKEESMKRVIQNENPKWGPNFIPMRGPLPLPPPPPPPPPGPPMYRNLYKRSTRSKGRRRKNSNWLEGVSFTDHKNCSTRCIFARMDMVNSFGFPDESLITKLIDDKITNKKTRLMKIKKVSSCFKKMEEVAFDDSCIFSARVFECLDLGEPYSWSNNK